MSFTCWPAGVGQGDEVKGAAGSVGALVPEDPDEVEDIGSTWPSRPTVKNISHFINSKLLLDLEGFPCVTCRKVYS